jgi:TPR repeat protein
MGFMYLRGLSVSRDYDEARKLFEEAFKTGQFVAPFGLAVLYRDGLGVTRDLSRAHAYADYSARKGYAPAAKVRDEIASKMSVEEMERARQIASEIASQAGI